jgi:BirA family biotin operon repressor/biotin-[acetyl-CoA-carboxylase] ligase
MPSLTLAARQRAGRGRGTNRWWSGNEALTFSILLDASTTNIPPQNWPLLSLLTGLAVADAIDALIPGCQSHIKWPNDVYMTGRKLCGILAETSTHRPGAIVVGIGLNVNDSSTSAPPELQARTISLVDITRRAFDRTEVLIAVLQRMAEVFERLRQDRRAVAEAWRQRCYLHGRTVEVATGQQRIAGVCQGIDDEGALLLHSDAGIHRCFGGVVTRIL